jgi:hypothetical protein
MIARTPAQFGRRRRNHGNGDDASINYDIIANKNSNGAARRCWSYLIHLFVKPKKKQLSTHD